MGIVFDATQMEVLLGDDETHEKFGRGERSHAKGPSVVAMMAQVHHLSLPRAGLGQTFEPLFTRLMVQPLIISAESASGTARALLEFDPVEHLLPLAGVLRYLLLSLQRDNAAYNGRAGRILLQEWQAKIASQVPDPNEHRCQVLVATQRCEGHIGAIILKLDLRLSQLLASMFSINHLLRFSSYRDAFLDKIRFCMIASKSPERRRRRAAAGI